MSSVRQDLCTCNSHFARTSTHLRTVLPAAGCNEWLCAGIDYTLPGKYASRRHFSGNFWWTTGAHYASLPEAIAGDYLGPEFHVLLRNESRVAQVWATGIGGGGMCVPHLSLPCIRSDAPSPHPDYGPYVACRYSNTCWPRTYTNVTQLEATDSQSIDALLQQ